MTVAWTLPGGVPVYFFSLLVGAGAALGIGRLVVRTEGKARARHLGLAFFALLCALAGARLLHFAVYPMSPLLELPLSGLSAGGAALGGLLGSVIAGSILGISPGRAANALIPLTASLMIAVWLGCWLDGCAYGAASDAPFALAARDEWGNILPRFPLQPLGAVLALLTIVFFDMINLRIRPALGAALWMALTGAQLAWLQALRADPAPAWLGTRLDLWAAWLITGAGVAGTLLILIRRPGETG